MSNPAEKPDPRAHPTDGERSDFSSRGEDRRDRPTPMVSRFTFRGRRRDNRRGSELKTGYYVDRQSTFEIVAVLSLLVLTITDALATLHIVGRGGSELNPIMASALELGDSYFLFSKLAFSLVGSILILLHTRFPGVRKALYALLTLYGAVVVYHAFLITHFVL